MSSLGLIPNRVAIAGATGYVGSRLARRLAGSGSEVIALSRRGGSSAAPGATSAKTGPGRIVPRAVDVGDVEATTDALTGCEVAYYLVHAMGGGAGFEETDRRQAESFARAAKEAGVDRIVYLGGLGNADNLSEHLRSRQETGEVLARFGPPVVELRAAVILGSGSASFEMLRALTERLPVMVTPRWVRTRTQPIAEADLLRHLETAATAPAGIYEIGGPEVTTYLGMMRSYQEARGLRPRRIVTLPLLPPSLSAWWADLVTPVDRKVAHPLIEGISTEVVVRRPDELFPTDGLDVTEAIRAALDQQSAAIPVRLMSFLPGAVEGVSAIRSHARLAAEDVGSARADLGVIGGDLGWYGLALAWRARMLLGRPFGERLALRRPPRVEPGARADWWRVEVKDEDTLVLGTTSWFCGDAWLGYRITDAGEVGGPQVQQVGALRPKGALGFAYWMILWPLHQVVFRVMAHRRATRARSSTSKGPAGATPTAVPSQVGPTEPGH